MKADLVGRVRNTRLPTAHGLLPLFEAIVNSVHAIGEAGRQDGLIEVRIERSPDFFEGDSKAPLAEITDFSVTDNGVGFTRENYQSFDTLDSQAKVKIGGKGVGRLLWLKAFESAEISSIYADGDELRRRRFQFRPTTSGIESQTDEKIDAAAGLTPHTTVRLSGFKTNYRDAAPRLASAIGRRIVEHCLLFYTLGSMPKVLVRDGEEVVDLSEVYDREFKKEHSSRSFTVGNHEFVLDDVLLRPTAGETNTLHFCADRRVVHSTKLASAIPHTDGPFRLPDGDEVMYWGCVSGDFLDQRVDAERTGFSIAHEMELAAPGEITWEAIQKAALEKVEEFLRPHTADSRQAALDRVRDFIQIEEPRYRILLEHHPETLETIPTTISDERLEIELHKILGEVRREAKADVQKSLQSVPEDAESFARFKEETVRALGELQEVAKSDLVEYVVHRAVVLQFLQKLLGLMSSGKFAKEDALHELFFPMQTTSDEIDYDHHNLWVLDETLAFHKYLSSDKKFAAQSKAPVRVDSNDRPDILIYNNKMAFAPDGRPFSSVVIVEFKRPERDDYDDDKNPVPQVMNYVRAIRSGTAKNDDGSSVSPVPETVPFFCHIVATLTPKLRDQLVGGGFFEMPGGDGYFFFNVPLRAFIQVSSYDKILGDAMKRNKAFFDKLQIPTKIRRL